MTKPATMSSSLIPLVVLGVLLAATPSGAARSRGDGPLECRFQCSGATKPSPRASHKKSANGCGTEGFRLPASALPHPDFETCCNEHDLCYDTCLADKARCDSDFEQCMSHVCDTKVTKAAARESCASTANLFLTMTRNLGCEPFLQSQRSACTCDSENEL
ncbi:group XIIA secretory phospholipase A2-like [Haemaphysalis longicornis]